MHLGGFSFSDMEMHVLLDMRWLGWISCPFLQQPNTMRIASHGELESVSQIKSDHRIGTLQGTNISPLKLKVAGSR